MGNGCSSQKAVSVYDTVDAVQDSGQGKPERPKESKASPNSEISLRVGTPSTAAETYDDPSVSKDTQPPTQIPQMEKGPGWRDFLLKVAGMDPWGNTRRQDRQQWQEFLRQAELAVKKPRRHLQKDVVDTILCGDMGSMDDSRIPNIKTKILMFVSSTFTDTQAERNILMKDVFPFLRSLCRILGTDFGAVDMRWGVKEEMTMEHSTTATCINEVNRCIHESAGTAFLAILGNKYGYRPFPAEIEQTEFDAMVNALAKAGEDTKLMTQYFQLDHNMVPAHYVLKPRKPDDTNWWTVFETLQRQLRQACTCLAKEKQEKYFVSVTEKEVQHGALGNPNRKSQVICVKRNLANVQDQVNIHRHLVDVIKDGGLVTIDEDAQSHLQELKNEKINSALPDDVTLEFHYEEHNENACLDYVAKTCDSICENLAQSILKNYQDNLHVKEDVTFNEVVEHRCTVLEKSSLFVGRENLLQQVMTYTTANDPDGNKMYAVFGESGCGKTALMAVSAKRTKDQTPRSITVVRFLGTTNRSGSARATLRSICIQVTRAYGRKAKLVPSGYKELIRYFMACMSYATAEKPLYIFLDSLDQLSNEDFGRNLKWLPLKETLPKHCHLVVSTIPGFCLNVIRSFLSSDQMLEVKRLDVTEGPIILDKMLSLESRTLTGQQKQIILNAFQQCPLPLYLRLATDLALKWRSYDDVSSDDIASDMPGLINKLFQRLESRYGTLFVHHALAYITAAKTGLSSNELEDVLSCDDDVLDELFEYWVPPFRRIPQLIWLRVREELGLYLVERGAEGVNAYSWYHRQFWETAEERYIEASPDDRGKSFRPIAHKGLADYFEGKWAKGKKHFPKQPKGSKIKPSLKLADRQVPSQPFVFTGQRNQDRKLNLRKLSELPYHLLQLKDWDTFKELVVTLEFMELKFEADQGYDCVAELREAAKQSGDNDIKAAAKFVGANLSYLLREPDALYQLASQQVPGNYIRELFDSCNPELFPRSIMRDRKETLIEDPCEMTMQGHESGIRCCQFSPNGELIVSAGEDGSMRIWDVFSGAEVCTVTGLPGPRYPGLADPYHGERPCCFLRDGETVATGAEDGTLQIFDLAGAQQHRKNIHRGGITGVCSSPDGQHFVTSSKDETVIIWDDSFEVKHVIQLPGQGLGCDFSPDGSKLAVSMYGRAGLVLIDTSSWAIESQNASNTGLNLCCSYSPDGKGIATGGDNSGVCLWDGVSGRLVGTLDGHYGGGHRGWIWSVHYSGDCTKLLTCSSDRSLKVWSLANRTCIASLGGHVHRLTSVSIRREQDKFVTSSLDMSLKIWDFQAVAAGRVPPVGGLYYSILEVSPDRNYLVASQGWNKCCTVTNPITEQELGASSTHDGFLLQVAFSPDSSKLVTLDTGHTGAYEADAARRAKVKVSSLPSGTISDGLCVEAPCTIACSSSYVAVGTVDSTLHLFDMTEFDEVTSWSWTKDGSPVADTQAISGLGWCKTGLHMASGLGRLVKIWNTSDPQNGVSLCTELPTLDDPLQLCLYAPSGEHFVTATSGGQIDVWDATSNYSLLHTMVDHVGTMRDLQFSADGRFLASAAVEMSMRIWDVANGYSLKTVYYAPINRLDFVTENVVVVGEATGNKQYLKFEI